MKRINIARILLIFAICLSIKMAFMIWEAINYSVLMIYAFPVGLYFPIVSIIILFKSFGKVENELYKNC